MSLIHLDKSVVTFHFKEILEDGHVGGPVALMGLSALMVGSKLLSNLAAPSKGARQMLSSDRYRPHMSLSEWVARAQTQQMSSTGATALQSPISISDSHSDNVPAAENLAA